MLRLQSVISGYGKIVALRGISLHVKPGEIVAIVGPNGAGKTTLLNTVAGILTPRAGSIQLRGRDVAGRSPDRMVTQGVIQVPEGRQLFARMTVRENLVLGAYRRSRVDKKATLQADIDSVCERFPILRERSSQLAGTLSGGEQQMLAIGRALMGHPALLLLDEPSMGLAPLVVRDIFRAISDLGTTGTTVLLVEQNVRAALAIAQRAYVLETGSIVMEGDARELSENPEIQRAYLGKGYRQIID